MPDKDLYGSFTTEEMDKYAAEAKERWGNTRAYQESQERVKNMSKEDLARIKEESDALMVEIAASIDEKPESAKVQALINRHFNNLRHFYEPSLEMYRGLAEMYIADQRFTAYYEKYAVGLTQFMHDAIIAYCEQQKSKEAKI